jgi:hypothetical protein
MFERMVGVPGVAYEPGQGTADAGAWKDHGRDEDGVAMPPANPSRYHRSPFTTVSLRQVAQLSHWQS